METGIIILIVLVGFGVANALKKLDTIEKRVNEVEESLIEEVQDNGINQDNEV